MKKVCFVQPRAYYLFNPNAENAADKIGGAQKQMYLLSIALAEDKNFDVRFLVADFKQPDFETIKNVKLYKSFNFSENIFKRSLKLLKTLKKINADTYIFQSADAGVAFALFYVKKIMKKKAVYMIAADAECEKKRQKKYQGFFTAFAMKFVYKKSDIITAQTIQQSYIFEKNRKRKPDTIIKNIFENELNSEIKHDEKDYILWAGRLSPVKNPELFLKTAEKYPREKFVMIAPVVIEKKSYGQKIKKQALKIKNLKYIDYVKPADMMSFYKKAKIYVLTSDFEGFSNTTAEAMTAECPVLSLKVNPDNILNDHKCGFCAEGDLNKFYSYFEKLNSDYELRKNFGKNGAKYISENHKKEAIMENFKKIS